MSDQKQFAPDSGIAIGPILFIIAILAVLAAVMSSGGGDFQTASVSDRVTADIVAQANLIRNTINDCNMQYSLAVSNANSSFVPASNTYPEEPESGLVADLKCTPMGEAAQPSIWGAILLPPPTKGFTPWHYVEDAQNGGGRCIWSQPEGETPAASSGIVGGLTHAATKFSSSANFTNMSEVLYDPASTSQKFIVWLTMPTGQPNPRCLP